MCIAAVALLLCAGTAARASAADASPAPSPAPAGPIDLAPMDMGEPPAPRTQPSPRPPRGSFTVNVARYRNDGSFATAVDVQRYLGPAGERRVRPYVAAAYGRETYTTLISTSAPLGPPPKVKPKKPKPTPPPIVTPFNTADTPTETALGVEFRASPSVRVYIQGGPGNQRDDGGDLRSGFVMHAGAEWYRAWEPARVGAGYGYIDGALNAAGGPFANTALILDAQRLQPLGHSERSPEMTLRFSAAGDSRGRYFSNVAELAAGIRIAPLGVAGPSLRLEAVAGQLGVGTALPKGMRRRYGALRPSISQSIMF
jgi:hypothetical protein